MFDPTTFLPFRDTQYEVSAAGTVRNRRTGKVLRGCPDDDGYLVYHLQIATKPKHFFLHRLVMETFVGPSSEHVAHQDGNPANCCLSNLMYATREVNESHKVMHGRKVSGLRCRSAKLDPEKVAWIQDQRKAGRTLKEIADDLGVNFGTVGRAARGDSWR